ncbi:hypothetical protein HWV07_04285 [Natronomonas salina]|uniref:hypothetical protein n=1 Tax=Natronomonas salina TaxID=1710540 RepID=UPI0015B71B50|nr:hypothetical protein [Natronomonas salina]QLD88292.1 hypothetical protein HWV07_04285 [Natronomonas salina]
MRRNITDATIEERIRKLEEIEDELRLVADTDCAYTKLARRWLRALKDVRGY